MRRAAVIRLSLVAGIVLLAWAALVFITGGIDARLFGITITSHDPMKLLLAASLALTVRVLAGGAIPLGWIDVTMRRLEAIRHQHIAWALALTIFGLGVVHGTR